MKEQMKTGVTEKRINAEHKEELQQLAKVSARNIWLRNMQPVVVAGLRTEIADAMNENRA